MTQFCQQCGEAAARQASCPDMRRNGTFVTAELRWPSGLRWLTELRWQTELRYQTQLRWQAELGCTPTEVVTRLPAVLDTITRKQPYGLTPTIAC